jgi:hypothetical protein
MARLNQIEVIPSANRLMTSLRGADYQFVSAVADLVDNSISANAGTVSVTLYFEGRHSWVRIADDGDGMDATTLTEAMRYGSLKEQEYDEEALGKFGLGLKTASLSQCKRVTVASRVSKERRVLSIQRWDLETIKHKWLVDVLTADEAPEPLLEPLSKGPGTVVLWENLDRVLGGYANPDGGHARNAFLELAEALSFHLGMVFHRFLDGSAKRRKRLSIQVNDRPIEPWDPFARGHKSTEPLKEATFTVYSPDGKRGEVVYRPFVLPTRDKLSPAEQEFYGRPDGWLKQQGFYVYRNGRLIRSGGWLNKRAADEHLKLARAAIEFTSAVDDAFEINIAKERVILPADLRNELDPHLKLLWKHADKVYRRSESGTISKSPEPPVVGPVDPLPPPIRLPVGIPPRTTPKPSDPKERVRGTLEAAARATIGENALNKLMEEVRTRDPEVARELGY